MRKINLDFGALEVESFATGGADGDGTVLGHDSTTDCGVTDSADVYCAETGAVCQPTHVYSCQATCPVLDTCSYTYCAPTCDHSLTSPCACV